MTNKLLWVDVETTGLDPNKDVLLEVGMVVTDLQLETIDSGCWVRQLSSEEIDIFADADEFVLDMHKKSGLLDEVLEADTHDNFSDKEILESIEQMYKDAGLDKTDPMCGSSLRLDRNFLDRYFPTIAGPPAISYRTIDVSSEKEKLRKYRPSWVSEWEDQFTEEDKAHRPLLDINYSISEFKFYLQKQGLL